MSPRSKCTSQSGDLRISTLDSSFASKTIPEGLGRKSSIIYDIDTIQKNIMDKSIHTFSNVCAKTDDTKSKC